MITIIYDEKEKDMILQASGHAGYAEKGSDIVCAAVSALMQTLAYLSLIHISEPTRRS